MPGEAIRGRMVVTTRDLAGTAPMGLSGAFLRLGPNSPGQTAVDYIAGGALSGNVLPMLHTPSVSNSAIGTQVYRYSGGAGEQSFSFGRHLPLVAPKALGDYLLVIIASGNGVEAGSEWVRITVSDQPKRIRVVDDNFSPYPLVKDQMSVLVLDFAVEGVPKDVKVLKQVTVEVKLDRIGALDSNGNVQWRIGFKHFENLPVDANLHRAVGRCNVRLTPRMATRYRLRYTVSSEGYTPAEGVIVYTVHDPATGAAPVLDYQNLEWVRTGEPEMVRKEWDDRVPDMKLVGTPTSLSLTSTRDNRNDFTSITWDEPPAVVKRGQRVNLSIRTAAHSRYGLGAKWWILCEHKERQGNEFLATFDQAKAVTLSATLAPTWSGPAPTEPVRMFWLDAGPWNSATHHYVYWRYLPRAAGSAGPLPPDEVTGWPTVPGAAPPGGGGSGSGGPVAGQPPKPADQNANPGGGGGGQPPAKPKTFTGTWASTSSDHGQFELQQNGTKVTGTFWGHYDLEGTVDGRIVRLTWRDRNNPAMWGGAKFTLSDDGNTLTGSYNDFQKPDVAQYRWDARRVK